jgi:hypothetical protein
MGVKVVIVLEMPSELGLVIERAERLGVRPNLGIRVRLASKGAGHWQDSGGDKSVFGLNAPQIIAAIDQMKENGCLDCLKLLHYHQGSQIPNIRSIREAAVEAARIYVDLVREGAPMGVLDIGGGLAVDYDGSNSNFHASCNYSIREYCTDVVETVMQACSAAGVPHPDLISESGRAVVAYYSVLVFNILDVSKFQHDDTLPEVPADASDRAAQPARGQFPDAGQEPARMLQRRHLLPRPDPLDAHARQRAAARARRRRNLVLGDPLAHLPAPQGTRAGCPTTCSNCAIRCTTSTTAISVSSSRCRIPGRSTSCFR